MCCVSFHRFCLGHHISCAMLQIPHVCCQTAHAHDGGLSRDTGRTSYKWTNSSKKKKSAVLLQALCFLSICNMVYFCRENISVGVFFSCFCPVAILMVRNEPTYTDMGGATECVTFEICWHKVRFKPTLAQNCANFPVFQDLLLTQTQQSSLK